MSNYPTLLQVFDGNNNLLAKQTRTYDEYGSNSFCQGLPQLTNISGASGHDDTGHGASFSARGNPTRLLTTPQRAPQSPLIIAMTLSGM